MAGEEHEEGLTALSGEVFSWTGRYFRIWMFSPTHSTLMFRSQDDEGGRGAGERIEIYFSHVHAVVMKPDYRDITLWRATEDEEATVRADYPLCRGERGSVFFLAADKSSFVLAEGGSWRSAYRKIEDPDLYDWESGPADDVEGAVLR